jgi:predicted ribosomally synthesized peptide with SipW-like signal peptide
MKRILISAGTLVFVGALAVSATGAFFSDTETSTGNTFAAGDIDLQIDNESYAIDCNIAAFLTCTGSLVFSTSTSWTLTDLEAGVQKFFNFSDLKPGDIGEDTISIHVGSNDAWLCAAARITEDMDNDITEPEEEDGDTDVAPGVGTGDLDSALNFAFWADDGDNVFEPGTVASGTAETVFLDGTLADMGAAGQITLADSTGSILGGTDPIPGDTTFYIGKAWCFGTLTDTDEPQDGFGDVKSPLTGTGFECDGTLVNNIAQTDSVEGDMQFYATQARNNGTFLCSAWDPSWEAAQ